MENYNNNCRNCQFARFDNEIEALTIGTNVLAITCTNDNFVGNLNDYGKPQKDNIFFDVNRLDVWIDACSNITDCVGFSDIENKYK